MNSARRYPGISRTMSCVVGSIAVSGIIVSSASAANITANASAPSAGISSYLASQLTDLGPGTQDNHRDYADNGGPPGQTFVVANPSILNSITVLGRGDSAGSWDSGAQPMTGSEVWGIQISSVNSDGSLNVLNTETATGFAAPANIADYITFTLDNPVSLNPGVTYAWSINLQTTTAWFGFAHSTGDVYSDGYAFNNNSSLNNPDDNTGGSRYAFEVNGFAAPNPNGYDYVFAAVGTVVPEPSCLALLGLGFLGLIARFKRGRP